VPVGYRGTLRISIKWLGHLAPERSQAVDISFDQTAFHVRFPAEMTDQIDKFDVVPVHDWIVVRTQLRRPVVADDGRLLGLGLVAIRLSERDAAAPGATP
jgi:hypothetical protein